MKFILTADDYGVSPIIDEAIEDAIEAGLVTAVAAFANIPGNKEGEEAFFDVANVLALQKRYPQVSVGLHLTVTSGCRVAANTTSLSPKWFGKRSRRFKGHIRQMMKVNPDHVYDEIKAQIKLFQDAGIEIEHFSDHHGILNHTKTGRDAYYEAVREYNRDTNKQVSIRNPLFISTLINDPKNPLDETRVSKKTKLGLFFQNLYRFLVRRGRHRVRAQFHMSLEEQREFLLRMNGMGIPATDYFVDSFWCSDKEDDIQQIFNLDNYDNLDPQIVLPLDYREPTVEIMLHLAKARADYKGDFKSRIKAVKAHKGVSHKYLQKGRLREARLLRDYLSKHCVPKDRVSFKPYLPPIRPPK